MDLRASDVVLTQEIGDKGVLILNRPKARNALDLEMINKLSSIIEKWQSSKSMIIVKSSLENIFCAGGDVATIARADTYECGRMIFLHGYTLDFVIANLKIPYIVLMNGDFSYDLKY